MKKIGILIIVLNLLAITHAAEVKWTAKTELTGIADTDILLVVDDPAGTPISKKITVLNFFDTINTSAKLATIITDGTGTGVAVFGTAPTFTTEMTLTPVASPTTDTDGEWAIDIDGWGANFDAFEFFNSTASAYFVATTASDTPTNGQQPTWNTGGEITWEAPGAGDLWSDAVDSDILPTGNDNIFDLGSAAASFKDIFWDGTATGNVTGALTGNADTVTTNANLTGEVTSAGNAATIADSVTVTGWVLGTSSATQITSPTLITNLIDTTGVADMDYGSVDVTDHTFTSDGGTTIIDGSVTAVTAFIIGAADMSEADLEQLDGITPGTAAASKALVLDGSLDIATINSATITTVTTTNNIKSEPKHLIFNIFNPLGVQGDDTQVCIWPLTPAAITITNIKITLDAAGNEIAGDLMFADTFIGLASATVINVCDTTSGVLDDSAMADGTVPTTKAIYFQFDSAPDTAITQMSWDITFSYD